MRSYPQRFSSITANSAAAPISGSAASTVITSVPVPCVSHSLHTTSGKARLLRKRLATYSIKAHGCHVAPHDGGGITEELKARDPMRWVGLINTLKAQAEKMIFQELIFQ